jgi:hypothetical protein
LSELTFYNRWQGSWRRLCGVGYFFARDTVTVRYVVVAVARSFRCRISFPKDTVSYIPSVVIEAEG